MRKFLIPLLRCPNSGGPLELRDAECDGDEVVAGSLVASRWRYPVIDGVPFFLTPRQHDASERFGKMWRYRHEDRFESGRLYGASPESRTDWLMEGFSADFPPGTWVLDAGCGPAVMTRCLAERFPDSHFIGLDASDTLRRTAKDARVRGYSNLHFIQADLMTPPLRRGTMDRVFAIGSLHHTSDTRTAFERVAALLIPGGEFLTWIYPRPTESLPLSVLYFIREVSLLSNGHKLSPEDLLRYCRCHALTLLPAMLAAYRLRSLSFFGRPGALDRDLSVPEILRTLTFILYDNLTPKYQFRHSQREVLGWYRALFFVESSTDGYGTFWGRSS